MSRVMRKPNFCLYICENKGADQLRSNCEADQRLCFRYTDSAISLLTKSDISVAAQTGLCQTRSETPKPSFLTSQLIYNNLHYRKWNRISKYASNYNGSNFMICCQNLQSGFIVILIMPLFSSPYLMYYCFIICIRHFLLAS